MSSNQLSSLSCTEDSTAVFCSLASLVSIDIIPSLSWHVFKPLLGLQDFSLPDKARMAHAALEVYARAGTSSRAMHLWECFWRPSGLANAATAKSVLPQPLISAIKQYLLLDTCRVIKLHASWEHCFCSADCVCKRPASSSTLPQRSCCCCC